MVRVPPIVRLLPPSAAAIVGVDRDRVGVVQADGGRQRRAIFQDQCPGVAGETGQRAVRGQRVLSATSALAPFKVSSAPLPIALIPPLANSTTASPAEVEISGQRRRRRRRDVQCRWLATRRRSGRSCRYWRDTRCHCRRLGQAGSSRCRGRPGWSASRPPPGCCRRCRCSSRPRPCRRSRCRKPR